MMKRNVDKPNPRYIEKTMLRNIQSADMVRGTVVGMQQRNRRDNEVRHVVTEKQSGVEYRGTVIRERFQNTDTVRKSEKKKMRSRRR